MSFCPSCGNAAQDGAKFCRFCGKPLPAYPASASAGRCSRCSSFLPSGAAFCMVCGAPAPKQPPVPKPQPQPEPAPPQPKPVPKPKPSPKSKRKPHNAKQLLFNILMAAAALLALLGVVVGALYVTGNLGYVTDFVHDLIHPETPDAPPTVPDGDLPNDSKQDDALPNGSKQDDTLPDGSKQDDTLPDGSKQDDALPDGSKQDDTLPDGSKQDDTLPDDVAPTPPPIDTLSAEEFEAAITHIRELYNEIESNRQAGTYDAYDPENGVVYYFSDDDLIAITTQPNVENNAYRRFYYYQDGVLFFAYYEGSDSYRFYFCQGRLIRLRYTPDTAVSNTAANYDQATTSAYLKWEERVLTEDAQLRLELSRLSAASESDSEYLLADSDSRYLTEDDLAGFTAEQCRLARNEIYARHGRRFKDPALQRYFDSLSWYNGTIEPSDFNDNVFNSYERANCSLIIDYEREHGYR